MRYGGFFAGWLIALAVILLIPGEQGFAAVVTLTAGLTTLGYLIGKASEK